jgi:hypothetical protein
MINLNTAPVDLNLNIPKGTTKAYEIQLFKNGAVEDITDWTITLVVKEKMTDPDSSAIINEEASLSDATSGKALIRLETVDTDIAPKSYFYAIKFEDDQSPANVGIIIRGRLTIEKTV